MEAESTTPNGCLARTEQASTADRSRSWLATGTHRYSPTDIQQVATAATRTVWNSLNSHDTLAYRAKWGLQLG